MGAGVVLVVAGIVILLTTDWITGVGAIAAGATIAIEGYGLHQLEENQPATRLFTEQSEINQFMTEFLETGSSAHNASCNLSWVKSDIDVEKFLQKYPAKGKKMTVFADAGCGLLDKLNGYGIKTVSYPFASDSYPHFTLLNMGREGSEQLAVVRQPLPHHIVDIYAPSRHPQVIAITKAYISRLLAEP